MDQYCLLSSGVTLGTYVPAVMLEKQMNARGLQAETYVLESFFRQDAQKKLTVLKQQIHQSFAFAKMAQKVSSDIKSSYDHEKLDRLFQQWNRGESLHLLVFSGFWISIVDEFIAKNAHRLDVNVQIIHMDASLSASWKLHHDLNPEYHHNWLFSLEANAVNYSIGIPRSVIPFSQRKTEVLIHGGGWGIGTYQKTLQSAIAEHFHINMVAYEKADLIESVSINYLIQPPNWNAWVRDGSGKHSFPPMIINDTDSQKEVIKNEYHGCSPIFQIVEKSQAIISKPGGATIMDSLHAATPLIYLEHYGKYENDNAKLWETLELGMSFSNWEATGFDQAPLERMHQNLLDIKSSTREVIDLLTHVTI